MKAYIKLVTVLLLSVCSVSCKKEKKDIIPTSEELLHGRWAITHFAWDMNSNAIMDEEEKESADINGSFAIVFNSDGTGFTSHRNNIDFKTNEQQFLWELTDEKEIRIVTTHSSGRDTSYTTIKKLTVDSCILERANHIASLDWRIMLKQK